jgi:hypothetical protein
VYDVSGRNIMNTQFNIKKENETYQFNLPELSRGVYLISLSDEGGGRYTQKIVINR